MEDEAKAGSVCGEVEAEDWVEPGGRSSITIEELVKKNIAALGENIQIRRFERFTLGEGLEKKNENFSDEVEKMIKK